MTEDQDAKESQSESSNKTFINKSKDKKIRTQRPLTKIILRRLPPAMTEEAFIEQVSPIPDHDHFYFSKPDLSLGNNVFSRAYINFINVDDLYLFRDKFDGYVFVDEKGLEYVGIVEYAPFQRIPKKKKKKDPKCGTIESDPIYQEFIESLSREPEVDTQPKLEYSYPVNDPNDKKVQSTPLLEYLNARKTDKRGRDERRRRENDKRKMRIERKSKETPIKKSGDLSEDENIIESKDYCGHKTNSLNSWYGEQRVYHKSKGKCSSTKTEFKNTQGSDDIISTDSDWDNHFPALSTKTHNTFTITSGKLSDKKGVPEGSQKSGGDTYVKEEEFEDSDLKRNKPREWDKPSKRDDPVKEGTVYESKTYRDQRKAGSNITIDKKKRFENDRKEEEDLDDSDKGYKKDKRDKFKESLREQKSKKYSDTRKERLKQNEMGKSDKQSVISKMISAESKTKSLNHDEIKPFTQLPQVKTDDLTKIIEGMDRRAKLEGNNSDKDTKDLSDSDVINKNQTNEEEFETSKVRRSSLDSGEIFVREEVSSVKHFFLEDRSKSTDREGSEEKDKYDTSMRRTERRIRNKDRPSLVIYQPGMGKFSKQRLAKDKDPQPSSTTKSVNGSENKDT